MRDLLPILIILACPIMMIFMMRGMRSGRDKSEPGPEAQAGDYGDHSPDVQLHTESAFANVLHDVTTDPAAVVAGTDHRDDAWSQHGS